MRLGGFTVLARRGKGAGSSHSLRGRRAFGSSYPFRAMAQSIEDYEKLGFRSAVLEKIFFSNTAALLKL
jgi:hypothetical protein